MIIKTHCRAVAAQSSKAIIFIGILSLLGLSCSHQSARERLRTPLKEIIIPQKISLNQLWTSRISAAMKEKSRELPVAVSGDTGYTATHDGVIKAIGLIDGKTIWTRRPASEFTAPPGIDKNAVYAAAGDGRLHAFNRANGQKLWSSPQLGIITAPPASFGGIVVARAIDGKVYGIKANSGKIAWKHERKQPELLSQGQSRPVFYKDKVIIGMDDGNLVSLDLYSGEPEWEEQLAYAKGPSLLAAVLDIDADPLVESDNIYAISYHGSINKINAVDGETVWYEDYSGSETPTLYSGRLITTAEQGFISSFATQDGNKLFEQKFLKGYDLTAPVIYGNMFAVGVKASNTVFWFDAASGNVIAKTPIGGRKKRLVNLSSSPYGVLSYTTDGFLSLLRPAR